MTKEMKDLYIIKFGTKSLMVDKNNDQRLDMHKLDAIASKIADAKESGIELIVVSSGSALVGSQRLGRQMPHVDDYRGELQERERECALDLAIMSSIGLSILPSIYHETFSPHGLFPVYHLVTQVDFKNTKNGVVALLGRELKQGYVPIVNYNDATDHREIFPDGFDHFDDNDGTAKALAQAMFYRSNGGVQPSIIDQSQVDDNLSRLDYIVHLVIVTDFELHDMDPSINGANLIRSYDISNPPQIEFGATSRYGKGGPAQKVKVCVDCATIGIPTKLISMENFLQYGILTDHGTNFVGSTELTRSCI